MTIIFDDEGIERETTRRPIAEVPLLTYEDITDKELFLENGQINTELLLNFFKQEGRLKTSQAIRILETASNVLSREPNLLHISVPTVICGDIHGQFYDLCKLFEVCGGPPPTNSFVFLGDYVDRGYFSIECFLYLTACKVNWPDKLALLRGNHECRHVTSHFTFKGECEYKYTLEVYERCNEAFDALPLAAVVNHQLLCVHGGISPSLKHLSDIDSIDRFQETPFSGLMCDILWTDPHSDYENDNGTFSHNAARGCSYRYSFKAVVEFLSRNKLLSVVRGHEAQSAGYRLYKKWDTTDFPTVMTVFSAPNYTGVYNNQAAVIKYDGNIINIRQFNSVPHPFQLPKFMNAFDWSFPFVGEKVAELLMAFLEIPTLSSKISGLTKEELLQLRQQEQQESINQKIVELAQISKEFAQERMETEGLSEFALPPNTDVIIPPDQLEVAEEEIKSEVDSFKLARIVDAENERLPPEEEGDAGSVRSEAQVEYPTEVSEILSEAGHQDEAGSEKFLSPRGESPPPTPSPPFDRPPSSK
jgi:serine/threonine-protein phosphatase 2B catalytic subunit